MNLRRGAPTIMDPAAVPPAGANGQQGPVKDRPVRRRRVASQHVYEFVGSAVAGLAIAWIIFTISGVSGLIGLAVLWYVLFFTIYAVVCRQIHGPLLMKDRLASVAVWSGAALAMIPLAAVILYVIVKGASVALAHFPHFFTADMSQLTATSPVTAVGAGAAIVGTVEQVGIAVILSVPLGIMTATYLADSNSIFSRIVSYVVDAMTGAPAIIAGLFVYLFWVAPRTHSGKSGLAAGMALAVMMLPVVTRVAQEVVAIVPGSLREAALALGAPQWRVMLRVVLPTARVGLMTAVILGIARIAGETAPVLFNAGGNDKFN